MTKLINKVTFAYMAAILALSGCGKQHKAESVVTDFLDNNLHANDYTVKFKDIDSTRHVSDSMVTVMRDNADNNKMYKRGIKYAPTGKQYIYLNTEIYVGDDTARHTFYLDQALTQVVAFK